jgi:hypothetical protein
MGNRTAIGKGAPEIISEIKADAGYFFLELLSVDGDKPKLYFIPILAWAIEGETFFPYPITSYGLKFVNVAYRNPNGVVIEPVEQSYFPDVHSWLEQSNISDALLHNEELK